MPLSKAVKLDNSKQYLQYNKFIIERLVRKYIRGGKNEQMYLVMNKNDSSIRPYNKL